MVLVQRQFGQSEGKRLGSRGLTLLAILSLFGGCIPSSGEYPYRAPDAAEDGLRDAGADADVCVSPSDDDLCESNAAECGTPTVVDPCGETRDIDCGSCTDGAVCTLENTCCQQVNDVDLCDQYNAECGTLEATDNCGRQRTVQMCGGGCADGVTCNGTTCGECDRESDRDFCDRFGKSCGTFSGVDNCGEQRNGIDCGACQNGADCTDGVCVCPGGTTETTCDDGEDNDCDGMEDCEDPDCDGVKCGSGPLGLVRCRNSECPL